MYTYSFKFAFFSIFWYNYIRKKWGDLMAHIVHCRSCNRAFNRDVLVEGVDWVKPSDKQYYHKACYEQWAKKQGNLEADMSNEEWFEALKYYLNHVIKAPIDWRKLTSQWNNFLKQKKTAKGIYFTMRYFYDVEKGDKEKSQGGIGIVSLIYQDSCNYWIQKFEKDSTIIEKIEQQARDQMAQQVRLIVQTTKKQVRKRVISLDDI